jgi:hypothetical protein
MTDSVKRIIFRERIHQTIGLCLLVVLALLAAPLLFWPPTYVTDGQVVDATVVRIGTYPVAGSYGGDLPILTIRLPNGTIRQVRASWSTAGDCLPGSKVSIVQRGTALQVTLRGCRQMTHSN